MPSHLLALHVGRPQTRGEKGAANALERPWTSAFLKEPAEESIYLDRTHLTGDEQADRENHGGPEKAVLCYAADHYPAWAAELQRPIPYGGFGENFTVAGLREEDVCIGDIYAVGEAIVQVAQPRLPCWKIARRWGIKDLALQVQETGRTGWYLRVLQEGHVAAGQALTLTERTCPAWTIARCNQVLHRRPSDFAAMQAMSECPLLAASLRAAMAKRAAARSVSNPRARLYGTLLG